MRSYETLVEALNDMRERGYVADFAVDNVCLYCGELDIRLNPEEFEVDEVHRFEGESNPDDSAVIYAITASTGLKGTLIDAYGAYAERMSFEMAQKLSGRSRMQVENKE